jgi:hypothetical protein
MNAALFLLLLIGGVLFLVAGLFLTRMNWRPDIEPFGRRSRALQIALHPENYATARRLGAIRLLNAVGGALLCASLAVVGYELYLAIRGR